MNYQDMTCSEFIEVLASKAPVPGGGGASALVGSIGMALGSMVGNLTLGRKKYAEAETDILQLLGKAEQIQKELLLLIDEDAKLFEPLSRAYKLPADTPEEKLYKAGIMEAALQDACKVPLKIMEICCEAIDLHQKFVLKGASIAISDVGCGVAFCRTALQGASLNVFINTKLMTDRTIAEDINSKADSMLDKYIPLADAVFHQVRERL